MTDEPGDGDDPLAASPQGLARLPAAVVRQRAPRSVWFVWLLPLVALGAGVWLATKTFLERGPEVVIRFRSGEGIESGKTKLKYKDVDIGEVKSVHLTRDYQQVEVRAELLPGSDAALVEDTRFWVVRPRIAGGTVSGLGTLLSGVYIGVDVGKSTKARDDFAGLEVPPIVTAGLNGREFALRGSDLGSLDVGAPVYFRRIPVGRVAGYQLDPDGHGVSFRVFVDAPYDRFVTKATRFWHASGVEVSLDANGLRVETQSLTSIVQGGIAFDSPPAESTAAQSEADAGTTFVLASSRDSALRRTDTGGADYVLLYKGSVRGLSIGAPVDFRGVPLGEVTDIRVDFRGPDQDVDMAVFIRVYPDRLHSLYTRPVATGTPESDRTIVTGMVGRGFRAQLRSGNLLTGQLYVALDFFPDAKPYKMDWSRAPAAFPTVPGTFETLQDSLVKIATRLERLPLDEIGDQLQHTLEVAETTLKRTQVLVDTVDNEIAPELRATMRDLRRTLDGATHTLADASQTLAATSQAVARDSPLQADTRRALGEVAGAAQALRTLADYLQRHPESLLRGKPKDAR